MKFMVIVKASPESEAGQMPTTDELSDMGAYNEELMQAGVMVAGEGLHPSSRGARVHFSSSDPVVTDGPFTETKDLIAGFWLWEVESLQEAIDWAKRIPFNEGQVEIRQVFTSDDFGEALTPELREAEENMREELEARQA